MAVSFLKNIIKSSPYVVKDILKKTKLNETYSIIETNIEGIEKVYDNLKSVLSSDDMKEELKYYKDLSKAFTKNIKDSVTTGRIHSKSRLENVENQNPAMKKMMADFDSSTNDWSMGDESSEMSDDFSPSINKSSSFQDSMGMNTSLSITPGMSSIQKHSKIQSQVLTIAASGINAGNDLLSKMIEFQDSKTASFYDQSLKFYSDISRNFETFSKANLEYIENTQKILKKYDEKFLKVEETKYEKTVVDRYGIDIEEYSKVFLKNVDAITGGYLEIFKDKEMRMQMIAGFEEAIANPLSSAISHVIAHQIPRAFDESLEYLNRTLRYAGRNLVKGANLLAGLPEDSFLGVLGRLFRYETPVSKFDTGKYEKGQVSFDGITKQAITHVIPTLLSQILSVNTDMHASIIEGFRLNKSATIGDYQIYDYDSGKFSTKAKIRQEYESTKRSEEFSLRNKAEKYAKILPEDQRDIATHHITEAFKQMAKSGKLPTLRTPGGRKGFEDGNFQEILTSIVDRLSMDFGIDERVAKIIGNNFLGESFDSMNEFIDDLDSYITSRNYNIGEMSGKSHNLNKFSHIMGSEDTLSNIKSLADLQKSDLFLNLDKSGQNAILEKIHGFQKGLGRSKSKKDIAQFRLTEEKLVSQLLSEYGPKSTSISDLDISNMKTVEHFGKLRPSDFKPAENLNDFITHMGDTINSFFFGDGTEGSYFKGSSFLDTLQNVVFGHKVSADDTLMDRISNRFDKWIGDPFRSFFNENLVKPIDKMIFDPETGFLTQFSSQFESFQKYIFGDPSAQTEAEKIGIFGSVKNGFNSYFTDFKKFLFGDYFDENKSFVETFGESVSGEIIEPFKAHLSEMFESLFGNKFDVVMDKAKKWVDDNSFGIKSVGGGILASMVLPGGPIIGGLLGLAYSTDSVQKYLYGETNEDGSLKTQGFLTPEIQDKMKHYGIRAGSGYLIGSIMGGPIIGGLLGLAYSTDSVQKFLYGGRDEETGETIEGFIGKNEKDTLRKYGINIGSGYVIGSLLGGPVIGGLLGVAHSTETVQNYLYGEGGLVSKIKDKLEGFRVDATKVLWGDEGLQDSNDPDISSYEKFGILGVVKEKFSDYGERLHRYLFGKKDLFTNEEGLLSGLVSLVKVDIWQPLKNEMESSMSIFRTFWTDQIIKPLKESWEPITVELRYQTNRLFQWSKEFGKEVLGEMGKVLSEAFGINVAKTLKDYVIDPMKKVLGVIKTGITSILKGILLFPVNIIKWFGDKFRAKHLANVDTFAEYYRGGKVSTGSESEETEETINKEPIQGTLNFGDSNTPPAASKSEEKEKPVNKPTISTNTIVKDVNQSILEVNTEELDIAKKSLEVETEEFDIAKKSLEVETDNKSFLEKISSGISSIYDFFASPSASNVAGGTSKQGLLDFGDPALATAGISSDSTAELSSGIENVVSTNQTSLGLLEKIESHTYNTYSYLYAIAKKMGADAPADSPGTGPTPRGFSIMDLFSFRVMPGGVFRRIYKTLWSGLKGVGQGISTGIGFVGDVITAPFRFLKDGIKGISKGGIGKGIGRAATAIGGGIKDLVLAISRTFLNIADYTSRMFSGIVQLFTTATEKVVEVMGDLSLRLFDMFEGLAKGIGSFFAPIKTVLSGLLNFIGGSFQFVGKSLEHLGIPMMKLFGTALGIGGSFVGKVFKGMFDGVKKVKDKLRSKTAVDIAEISTDKALSIQGILKGIPMDVRIVGVDTEDSLKVVTISSEERDLREMEKKLQLEEQDKVEEEKKMGFVDRLKSSFSKTISEWWTPETKKATLGNIAKGSDMLSNFLGNTKMDENAPLMQKMILGGLKGGSKGLSLLLNAAFGIEDVEEILNEDKSPTQGTFDFGDEDQGASKESVSEKPKGFMAGLRDSWSGFWKKRAETRAENQTNRIQQLLLPGMGDELLPEASHSPEMEKGSKEAQLVNIEKAEAAAKTEQMLETMEQSKENTSMFGKIWGYMGPKREAALKKFARNWAISILGVGSDLMSGMMGSAGGTGLAFGAGRVISFGGKYIALPLAIAYGAYSILRDLLSGLTDEKDGSLYNGLRKMILGDTSDGSLFGRLKNAVGGAMKGGAAGATAAFLGSAGIGTPMGFGIGSLIGGIAGFFGKEIGGVVDSISSNISGALSFGASKLNEYIIQPLWGFLKNSISNSLIVGARVSRGIWESSDKGALGVFSSVMAFPAGMIGGLFGASADDVLGLGIGLQDMAVDIADFFSPITSYFCNIGSGFMNGPGYFYNHISSKWYGLSRILGFGLGLFAGPIGAMFGMSLPETFDKIGGNAFNKQDGMAKGVFEMFGKLGESLTGALQSIIDTIFGPLRETYERVELAVEVIKDGHPFDGIELLAGDQAMLLKYKNYRKTKAEKKAAENQSLRLQTAKDEARSFGRTYSKSEFSYADNKWIEAQTDPSEIRRLHKFYIDKNSGRIPENVKHHIDHEGNLIIPEYIEGSYRYRPASLNVNKDEASYISTLENVEAKKDYLRGRFKGLVPDQDLENELLKIKPNGTGHVMVLKSLTEKSIKPKENKTTGTVELKTQNLSNIPQDNIQNYIQQPTSEPVLTTINKIPSKSITSNAIHTSQLNNTNYSNASTYSVDGLKIKSEETIGGGSSHPGLLKLAHSIQNEMGNSFWRFTALNDRWHAVKRPKSIHPTGRALDFTIHSGRSGAQNAVSTVKNILSNAGLNSKDYQLLDEYNYPSKGATGGHIHVAFKSKSAADMFLNSGGIESYDDITKIGTPSASMTQPSIPTAEFTQGTKETEATFNTAIAYKASQENINQPNKSTEGTETKDNPVWNTIAEYLKLIVDNTRETADKDLSVNIATDPNKQMTPHEKNKLEVAAKEHARNSPDKSVRDEEYKFIPQDVILISRGSSIF